jgi:nicotinamidase-related amidase
VIEFDEELATPTALLLIDLQLGNFADEEPRIHAGQQLIDYSARLLAWARAEVMPVIFVLNEGESGDVDEPGTPGYEVHPALEPLAGEVLISKETPDSFLETGLTRTLEEMHVTSLIVAGLQTEYCIDTSCRSAWRLGYDVTLVSDAHSTWDGEVLSAEKIIAHHNSVLGGWFTRLATTDEIISGAYVEIDEVDE